MHRRSSSCLPQHDQGRGRVREGQQAHLARLSATAAAAALRVVAPTLAWRVAGLDHWRGGVVLTLWHGQIVLGAALLHHLGRAADCIAVVVPEYGQSSAMSAWARDLGLAVALVPGYGDLAARRAALRALVPLLAAGKSVVLPADGHRAPAGVVRNDPLWLAGEAGVPLLPVALAARRAVRLPTWDRKALPLPFSRVGVAIAAPMAGAVDALALTRRIDLLAGQATRLRG